MAKCILTTNKIAGSRARIKHRMKTNWLKMYDKFGVILRIETVINSPKEFSVYRTPLTITEALHRWDTIP